MTKELDVRSRCMGIRRTKTGSIRTPMTFNTAEGNRAREIKKRRRRQHTWEQSSGGEKEMRAGRTGWA